MIDWGQTPWGKTQRTSKRVEAWTRENANVDDVGKQGKSSASLDKDFVPRG